VVGRGGRGGIGAQGRTEGRVSRRMISRAGCWRGGGVVGGGG